MKCALERNDPFSTSRTTGKFQRPFHRFGARVTKEDSIEVPRRAFCDRFGEQAAQERTVHLHHIRQIEIEHVADSLFYDGVIPPDVKNRIAAEEIEIGGVI